MKDFEDMKRNQDKVMRWAAIIGAVQFVVGISILSAIGWFIHSIAVKQGWIG
jgi:hypothetical protein